MKTIHKYALKPQGAQKVKMPEGAQILHAGEQEGSLFIWARVNTEHKPENRKIEVYGTGHEVNEFDLEHISTVQMSNGLVFHVFENH